MFGLLGWLRLNEYAIIVPNKARPVSIEIRPRMRIDFNEKIVKWLQKLNFLSNNLFLIKDMHQNENRISVFFDA